MTQTVKNPPAMRETRIRSLGWEDPLEQGMAPHPSILAWKIQISEELQSMGSKRVRHSWTTITHTLTIITTLVSPTTSVNLSLLHKLGPSNYLTEKEWQMLFTTYLAAVMGWIYVSLENSYVRALIPKCDGICNWGLSVIRVRWVQKGGTLMMELVPLWEESLSSSQHTSQERPHEHTERW